ncbi:hypothetical protein CROQUDRAFT_133750 [Cronartium quercuum f. sp. fusiforme G11]|uniref:Uncharacterized protein n=1 Tax=Cronartium quercuum f. sp. fusiforme G11 TaxID=708437 RepID=A0A9P6NEL4_9BASI|nr:hypothetical protein CROQUDRAFT_133750 [Cronartium quercuum f. sp. fusiforme G11]
MSEHHDKGKGRRVREIFSEDFDEDVVDYESGLRRQAQRAEQEANQPASGKNDIIIIHLEPTPSDPIELPEPSTSSAPDSRSRRSGIRSLTRALGRILLTKKSKPITEFVSDEEESKKFDNELIQSIVRGDHDALMKADYDTLKKVLKWLEKEERRRKRFGILATDTICEDLKKEFGELPKEISESPKEPSESLEEPSKSLEEPSKSLEEPSKSPKEPSE